MRHFLYALCVAISVLGASPAFAANDSRAFPPDNCTTGSPFMGFTGVNGSNTFCNSGQDIFKNALPSCATDQIVSFDGAKFICKDMPAPNACASGYALTYTTAGFQCMKIPDNYNVQACAAPNFLTYNPANKSFICSSPASLNLSCPSGQVLTGIASNQAVCTPMTAGTTSTMADCALVPGTFQSQYLQGVAPVYLHRNADGNYAEGANLYLANPWLMVTPGTATMKPTGWQDTQPPNPNAGGITGDGATCGMVGDGINTQTYRACYTCVNGNWTQYQTYSTSN